MQIIYDDQGNELGSIPLSEKQRTVLEASGKLSVLWHTPQLLQPTLGNRSGSFMLYKDGDRVVALTSSSAKQFLELQAAIKAARELN